MTAAVHDDIPADWDARRIDITMRDEDSGPSVDGAAMTETTTNYRSSDDRRRTDPPAHLAGLAGMDLVRRTLEEARGAARIQGKDVGRGRSSPGPPPGGGHQPTALVGSGSGLAGPTAARVGDARPGAQPRLVGPGCRGFGVRPVVGGGR